MEALKTKFAGMERFTKPTTKATSRRAYLLEQFLQRLNTEERRSAGYKDITPARLGMMVAHLDDSDLHDFFQSCCKYSGAFSKCFFGSLKVKK